MRFAEVMKKLEEHSKEIERLETTKADARAVWAEFRNRPDMPDVDTAIANKVPEIEKRLCGIMSAQLAGEISGKETAVKELRDRIDSLAHKMHFAVDQHEFDAKMEEWATLVRATVRADDCCQWCKRPILARAPGEKACSCNMRER